MIAVFAAWRYAVLLLAAAPLVYYALATLAALRFFRRARVRVLPDYTPPVSMLKPVRGVDFGSYENFASFCRQEYPNYEILFAVNDAADPAVPSIRRIIADFPERKIRLLVGAEHLGANRKVNKLARLAWEARNEVLVLTDGDVRVGPHFLREVVAPLANHKTGAVTSFYRGIAEKNLGAQIEAVGASSDFFAGVLMAGPGSKESPLPLAPPSPQQSNGSPRSAASKPLPTRWRTIMNSATASPKRAAKSFSHVKPSGPCIPPKPSAASGTIKCAGRARCVCAGHSPISDFFLHKDCPGFCSPQSSRRRSGSPESMCSHTSSCVLRWLGRWGFGASETKSCAGRFGWYRCATQSTL